MRRLCWLTILAAVAAPLAAQETPRADRDRDRGARDRTFSFSFGPEDFQVGIGRGRLGVLVDLTPDPARDSVGARVAGVTPGGPADRAGVRTGDLIVRLNGTRLAPATGQPRDENEDEQSRPGMRLIRLASRLDGGDTVRLELRRDNRPITVTLVAQESDVDRMVRRFERVRELVPGEVHPRVPRTLGRVQVMAFGSRALADLELVRVNPGLAQYFGTSEGLLVVDGPSDSLLGLRSGDVILSIGGRRPTSPAQAMRILSTYEPREVVRFEIMRQKRRTTINGRMPEDSRETWRVRPNGFEIEVEPSLRHWVLPHVPLPPLLPAGTPRLLRIEGEV